MCNTKNGKNGKAQGVDQRRGGPPSKLPQTRKSLNNNSASDFAFFLRIILPLRYVYAFLLKNNLVIYFFCIRWSSSIYALCLPTSAVSGKLHKWAHTHVQICVYIRMVVFGNNSLIHCAPFSSPPLSIPYVCSRSVSYIAVAGNSCERQTCSQRMQQLCAGIW